jgi:hypothetical protein
MKVFNSATVAEERREKAKTLNTAYAFRGSKEANLEGGRELAVRFEVAANAEDMDHLRHRIITNHTQAELQQILRNAESAPATADLEAFFGRFFLDVTRRAQEAPDLTSLIAMEQTNFNFPKLLYLKDVLPYIGAMEDVSGEGDSAPLIQAQTGEIATMSLAIKAVGWKDSLANRLWNEWFSMDKVVKAAVDSWTDMRNKAIIGAIVARTTANAFVASQKQAAITTSGLTYDEKVYETLLAGIKVLRGLLDIQTKRKIAVSEIRWLGNSANTWSLENVIRGQLNGNGSTARMSNRPALDISQIVEYDKGINDGKVLGKKTLSFPGVTAGKGYLYVPDYALVANKRPLTMETGIGSVIEFSTEERSWYSVQGEYLDSLLGSSAVTPAGGAAGYGAIVEVTLP